jgi:hypothetical protein
MALSDMEHDRPRLEQGEIAFFIGRDLPDGCSARWVTAFSALKETRRTL